MPKLYEGPEPCMGCGTPGTQRARSAKNHLCEDCMTALRIGQTIVKERGLERNYYQMDDLTSGEAVDAAYEMVCWLLEKGFIKKED